jgi:hypothetical protein
LNPTHRDAIGLGMTKQNRRPWYFIVRRAPLTACLGAVLAVAVPPSEGGKSVPTEPMAGLTPAARCVASLPWFGHQDTGYAAPQGTIAMTDDGGWCALQFVQVFRQLYIVPEISVVVPPGHGEARAERLPGRLAIVYRPAPGFVGTDRFEVRTDGPISHTIPIDVTVK